MSDQNKKLLKYLDLKNESKEYILTNVEQISEYNCPIDGTPLICFSTGKERDEEGGVIQKIALKCVCCNTDYGGITGIKESLVESHLSSLAGYRIQRWQEDLQRTRNTASYLESLLNFQNRKMPPQ